MEKKVDCVVVGPIQTNCWLYLLDETPDSDGVSDSGGMRPCAVIDPGDEAALIVSRLKKLNWIPRYIFLTHGHFDHLAGLPELLDAFGKGAWAVPPPKVCIHRQDAHYLGKDALTVHRNSFMSAGGDPAYINVLWKPMPEADLLLEEGDIVGPFKVLHVPGHTAGSSALYDEKAGVLFTGDTLFRGDYGRTDLPGGSEELIRESLKRLLALNGEIKVCPGHGAATTIKGEAGLQFY